MIEKIIIIIKKSDQKNSKIERRRKGEGKGEGGGGGGKEGEEINSETLQLPFPINTSEDLLHWCRKTGLSIYEVVMENEQAWRTEAEIKSAMLKIWTVMKECI